MSGFVEVWRRHYGDAPPLSFALRDLDCAFWLRFHALPSSKRYADNAEENRVVLDRARTLARAVLGEGSPCWLVQTGDWETPADQEARRPFFVSAYHYDEGDWPAYAELTSLPMPQFDSLIAEAARGAMPRVLWINQQTGGVFAPYDGGFDLFLRSSSEVEFLKARHSGWLSQHPDGL